MIRNNNTNTLLEGHGAGRTLSSAAATALGAGGRMLGWHYLSFHKPFSNFSNF